MPLPPELANLAVLDLLGKLLAGGGIGAALFLVGRLFLRAQVLATWAWVGAMFAFGLAALALLGIVDVNPGRAIDLGRYTWELGVWLQRYLGVTI